MERRESVILAARTRTAPGGETVDYTAYFEQTLTVESPIVDEIRSWAERIGEQTLLADGGPFVGMSSSVSIGGLTRSEVEEFRTRFKPSQDISIPVA